MNKVIASVGIFLLSVAIISIAWEADADMQADSAIKTPGSTTGNVGKYFVPDESSYDRSQLSGIKDYEKFANGQDVLFLARSGKTDYSIYVDSKATAAEKFAAQTLADYLKRITGVDFPVVNSADSNMGKVIAVGPEAARQIAPDSVPDFSALGHDGIVIKVNGQNLILTGAPGSRRGTFYAVVTLLENIGCRWWTDTEMFVPQKPTLKIPRYNVQYRPALDCRDVHYYFMGDSAVYNKLNGNEYKIPEERGGMVEYKGPSFVHTFGQIVTCKEYAASHPEWFAEINGKRQFGKWDGKSSGHVMDSQLCMSTKHTDLLELIIGKVKGYLKDAPPDSIVSLSQNDSSGNTSRCECADCLAVEKEEGSPSGPILRFVNQVAAAIEKDFPQAKIDTLAYLYSQKPPAVTKPRPNVVIRLCAWGDTNNLAPYDSKVNERFYTDLIGWSKLTSNIHVWDYTTDFYNYGKQFPNIFVTSNNIRLFMKNGVKGIMLQSSYTTRGGDMADLKHWVYSKILWDQSLDEKALTQEFVTGYYGEGAPYVSKYMELLYAEDPLKREYFRLYFLEKAYALYLAGKTALKNDAASRRKLELAFTPVLNAIMQYWPYLLQECGGKTWPFPEKPAIVVDDFIRICTENNVGHANERGDSPAKWAEQFRVSKRIGKPAEEFKHIAAEDKVEMQDDMFRLYRKDVLVFVIADEKASDGYAVSMPSTHAEWAVQCDLTSLPVKNNTSGKWKAYAAIKIIKKGDAGLAFEAGVYDSNTKMYPVSLKLSLDEVKDENYNFHLIGSFVPAAGQYIYLLPTKNPDNVKEIIVDRFILVRDE